MNTSKNGFDQLNQQTHKKQSLLTATYMRILLWFAAIFSPGQVLLLDVCMYLVSEHFWHGVHLESLGRDVEPKEMPVHSHPSHGLHLVVALVPWHTVNSYSGPSVI